MRLFLLFLILAAASTTVTAQENAETVTVLEQALTAYQDSKALNHKADTFLHAQRAYNIGQQVYAAHPRELAPIAYAYAQAAANYREPIALSLFEQTIKLYTVAYGTQNALMTFPLIDAAEEALSRRKPETAYHFYSDARAIEQRHKLEGSAATVRIHMGLARMYLNAGENIKAKDYAHTAIEALSRDENQTPASTKAETYYWLGQVERKTGNNLNALDAYEQALSFFETYNPRHRQILTIHMRLVEIHHKLGRKSQLVAHCIAAEQWQRERNMGIWDPIYDPNNRLIADHQPQIGEIAASFIIGLDCKARDIKVYAATGVSAEEAEELLIQAYFTPNIKNGVPVPGFHNPQTTIMVYAAP